MIRSLLILVIAVAIFPAHSFAAGLAGECRITLMAMVKRVAPEKESEPERNGAYNVFMRLRTGLLAEREAALKELELAPPFQQEPIANVIVDTSDGNKLRYSHGDGEQRAKPIPIEEYGRMIDRLSRMIRNVEQSGEFKNGFYLKDPRKIRELLTTTSPEKIRELEDVASRQQIMGFTCAIAGAGYGIYDASTRFERDPNVKLDAEIVERAKKTTVTTEQQHLDLVESVLGDNEQKATYLAQHKETIKKLRERGYEITFGGRLENYDRLSHVDRWGETRDNEPIHRVLEYLLNGKPINQTTLQQDAGDYFPPYYEGSWSQYSFLRSELEERRSRAVSDTAHGATQIGRFVLEAAAGAAVGYAACAKVGGKLYAKLRDRFTGQASHLSIPPGMEELWERFEAASNPDFTKLTGGPRDGLWIGAGVGNAGSYHLTDIVLMTNRSFTPPRIELAGVNFVMNEERPEPAAETSLPPLKNFNLGLFRKDYLAKRFPNLFGDDLKPLDTVFELAEKSQLTPQEQARFVNMLQSVKSLHDMKDVRDFLLDLRQSSDVQK